MERMDCIQVVMHKDVLRFKETFPSILWTHLKYLGTYQLSDDTYSNRIFMSATLFVDPSLVDMILFEIPSEIRLKTCSLLIIGILSTTLAGQATAVVPVHSITITPFHSLAPVRLALAPVLLEVDRPC